MTAKLSLNHFSPYLTRWIPQSDTTLVLELHAPDPRAVARRTCPNHQTNPGKQTSLVKNINRFLIHAACRKRTKKEGKRIHLIHVHRRLL